MKKRKVSFESMPWESAITGVRFKAHQQNGRKLRLVEFAQGFVEPDWCLKGHIGYLLEGEMEIDFNGTMIEFRPGDGIFIEPGEVDKHKARVKSDFVRLVLVEEA
ncbi:MAG: hypothetical protein PHV74_13695 [Dehalococcoidia bacterium]|nr:hypothetical protein [Dehalococcoidia bacterium]